MMHLTHMQMQPRIVNRPERPCICRGHTKHKGTGIRHGSRGHLRVIDDAASKFNATRGTLRVR